MKVAALQMVSTPDVAQNLETALRLVAEAASEGAELVALPEYFCLMGRHDSDKLALAEPFRIDALTASDAPLQKALAACARQHGVWLLGGTLPLLTAEPRRVSNSLLVWTPEGRHAARYDKIHLFCFDDGQQRYDESVTLTAGRIPVAFEATDRQGRAWRVGLGICYDLRFPELFRHLGSVAPLDLIVLPAAFTWTTGHAHWELLLRARAVENLCHVMAPAQGGVHENGRQTWGHSLVAGPWGDVLACQAEGEGVVMAELSAAGQASRRQQLPALDHRVLR